VHSEVKRRIIHVSGTAVPAAYLLGILTWTEVRWLVLAGSLLALTLEFFRLVVGLDWQIYDELTRSYEQDYLAGYALYVFGGTAVALLFEPRIAIPAMLMLTISDPVSGLLSARELRPAKRASILVVTFLVSLAIASPFLPLTVAVLGALAATLADGVKPVVSGYVIDDNISIPIGAGVVMFLALEFLPGRVL